MTSPRLGLLCSDLDDWDQLQNEELGLEKAAHWRDRLELCLNDSGGVIASGASCQIYQFRDKYVRPSAAATASGAPRQGVRGNTRYDSSGHTVGGHASDSEDDDATSGAGASDKAWKRPKPEFVAMKVMDAGQPGIRDMWLNEVGILRRLAPIAKERNLLEYVDAYTVKGKCYILTGFYSGGDLFSAVETLGDQTYSERTVSHMLRHMFRALNACHALGITHRDIKPENFVFSSDEPDSSLRLIDFGCSKVGAPDTVLVDKPQSVYYVAPEVLAPDAGSDHRYAWRRCAHCSELYSPGAVLPGADVAAATAGAATATAGAATGAALTAAAGAVAAGNPEPAAASAVAAAASASSGPSSLAGRLGIPTGGLLAPEPARGNGAASPTGAAGAPGSPLLPSVVPGSGGVCSSGGPHVPDAHGVYRLRRPPSPLPRLCSRRRWATRPWRRCCWTGGASTPRGAAGFIRRRPTRSSLRRPCIRRSTSRSV